MTTENNSEEISLKDWYGEGDEVNFEGDEGDEGDEGNSTQRDSENEGECLRKLRAEQVEENEGDEGDSIRKHCELYTGEEELVCQEDQGNPEGSSPYAEDNKMGNPQIEEKRIEEEKVTAIPPGLTQKYVEVYNLGRANSAHVYFYKLRDRDSRGPGDSGASAFFSSLSGSEGEAKRRGSIYDPSGRHNWQKNLHWVLGVVHKGRRILVNSRIILKNLFRKDSFLEQEESIEKMEVKRFSAFTLEIASAIKAGYSVELEDKGLILSPKAGKDYSSCTLESINPTPGDVDVAYKKVIKHIVKEIETFAFDDYLEWCALETQKKKKRISFPKHWKHCGELIDDNKDVRKLFLEIVWIKLFIYDYNDLKEKSTLKQLEFISFLALNDFIYQDSGPASFEDFEDSLNSYKVWKSEQCERGAVVEESKDAPPASVSPSAPPKSLQFLEEVRSEDEVVKEEAVSNSEDESTSPNHGSLGRSRNSSDSE